MAQLRSAREEPPVQAARPSLGSLPKPTLDPTPTAPEPRDANGRFAAGNPGGPGRPKSKGYELQRAAQDAITPDHIAALMRKALRMALEGNLSAMPFVVERTCGKAPDAPPGAMALDIQPPRLKTAADCTAAIQKVPDAICAGTLDLVHGKVLLDAIATQAKLIQVGDLETRLVELEKTAATVEVGGRNGHRR